MSLPTQVPVATSDGAPPSRLGLEEQIALYSVFHRSPVNRALHNVTMPLIIISGLMILAPLGVPVPGALGGLIPLNAGLLIVVVSVGAFALLDGVTTLAFAGWALPSLLLANFVASRLDLVTLMALGFAVQGVAWFLAVRIGHERFEPTLLWTEDGESPVPVSSNLYFRRGFFFLRNVGRSVSVVESFQQWAISPFAATLDLLFSLGYRPDLRARIDVLARTYMGRIARGETILPSGEGAPQLNTARTSASRCSS
jgi:uncharacterized membrane protein YGL010W